MKAKLKPSKCPRGMGKGKGKSKAEVDDSSPEGNLPVYLDLMPPRDPDSTPKVTTSKFQSDSYHVMLTISNSEFLVRKGDGVEPTLNLDDLDALQNELEAMLLRSVGRANLIRSELSAPSTGAESSKAKVTNKVRNEVKLDL